MIAKRICDMIAVRHGAVFLALADLACGGSHALAQEKCHSKCPDSMSSDQLRESFDSAFDRANGDESRSPVPVISVSRAADLDGTAVYAARSTFSGTASVVTFSSRPVREVRARAVGERVATDNQSASAALTSGFGLRKHPILGGLRPHTGIDLAARDGALILAGTPGVVVAAGWKGGYGLFVALDHGGGMQTRYAHMSHLNVVVGQKIGKGQVIGQVGSTGLSTGPHLHYEVRLNGQAINPSPGLTARKGAK